MAKLAAFPKCYVEDISRGTMGLSEWIEMASGLPVDGLELYDKFLRSHGSHYVAGLRREIADHGFEMPMMCYSSDFTSPDRDVWRREVSKQCDVVKITADLGGSYCRILSGQGRPDVSVSDGIQWVVEAIHASLETATANNVSLVMENHYKDPFWQYPEFAQRGDVFVAIVERIDSPRFGVQYDPSNAIVAGECPLRLLERVKQRVKTMHASDRYLAAGVALEDLKQSDGTIGYSPHLRHGVVGKGLNDYDAIFKTLKQNGFSGWISIEDGMNGLEEIRESAVFLRRKMQQYGFSEDAKP
jgi:sugar phosphate isomerase/epimerase